ncbi:MAG: 16S rRNA (adenine(1518)-N(6)/adenine(1519)-N(6))-dimethyltransferase RsmA [Bacteroidota bacterium]
MDRLAPKKSLGQNFLTDRNMAAKIVRALDISPDEPTIEIGPGEGALTGLLIESGARLTAVDIDIRAIALLKEKFKDAKLEIISGDFREIDLGALSARYGQKLAVIGNIPYNISSDIFFKLFESAGHLRAAVLTVQKEVARRVNSGPGSKEYGILSVARAMAASSRIQFDIPPGCFFPRPKVTSSVIRLEFFEESEYADKYNGIMRLVRAAFNQRRKMLGNSLKSYISQKSGMSKAELTDKHGTEIEQYFSRRPEQMAVEDFARLYEMLG